MVSHQLEPNISIELFWYIVFETKCKLTDQEADPPQAIVEGHLYVYALIERKNHPLLQVQPVVGAHGDSQQAQATYSEHAA